MANYVLVFSGGGKMPESEEEKKQVMDAWTNWYKELGDKVKDMGNPFGPSKQVSAGGDVSEPAASGLSGYCILEADSLDDATAMAKDCPVLDGGSDVEVYETFDVM